MGYNLRFSFVSLIEKAMAKIHGSYKTLYEIRSVQRYMVELTGNLCIEEALHQKMPEKQIEDLWADFLHAFTIEKQLNIEAKKSKVRDVMMGLFKGRKDGLDTNFQLFLPYKILYALDLPNQDSKIKP